MATTYQVIRDQLKTKLESVTAIQEVARYPKRQFNGYPAAIIVSAEGESEWETNAEHERVYAFDIQIFYETKPIGNDTALDALFNVMDEVLDEFAEDTLLSGISLPAGKSMITVEPLYAGWEELDDTELLMGKISVRVRISLLI